MHERPEAASDVAPDRALVYGCHLSTVLALTHVVAPIAGPVLAMAVPLWVWHRAEGRTPALAEVARDVLCFQITLLGFQLAAWLAGALGVAGCLSGGLSVGVALAALAFPAVAVVRTAQGERYRYPVVWRPF